MKYVNVICVNGIEKTMKKVDLFEGQLGWIAAMAMMLDPNVDKETKNEIWEKFKKIKEEHEI